MSERKKAPPRAESNMLSRYNTKAHGVREKDKESTRAEKVMRPVSDKFLNRLGRRKSSMTRRHVEEKGGSVGKAIKRRLKTEEIRKIRKGGGGTKKQVVCP